MNKDQKKIEKIKKELFEVRPLKQKERFKSIDFWEGYTLVVSRLLRIINNND